MSEKSRRSERIFPIIYMLYSVTTIIMLVFSMILFVHNTYAATNTTISNVRGLPGVASLADPQVLVKTVFSGADAGNLSITYTWKEDDGDDNFTTPLGSHTTETGIASPYQYAITGLDNSKTYRVKVDFTDPGGSDSIILIALKPYNNMIHNAVSTDSGTSKWASGWGVSGGEYGAFECGTCHQRKSGNIKRIRNDWADITVPDVPIKTDSTGETVSFSDARDGAGQFAIADTQDHNGPDRICEACHTQTSYHQHDMTAGTADHNSKRYCLSCHPHTQGFKPIGCGACHGGGAQGSVATNMWPDSADKTTDLVDSANDSGEHEAHVAALAKRLYNATLTELLDRPTSIDDQQAICLYCHAVNDDDHSLTGDDDAEVFSATVGGSSVTVAKSMWGAVDNGITYTAASNSCSTTDCHNDTTVAVTWYGGTSSSCNMCHNTNGTTNPNSGLHSVTPAVSEQRHDSSVSGGCAACHTSLLAQSTHIDGTTQDGNGQEVQMGLAAFYTQTADNAGTCTNTNCHLEVSGGTLGSSDDWGHQWNSTAGFYTNATSACGGCHGDWANSWNSGTTHRTSAGTSAKHGTGTNYSCKDCHNLEASSGYIFTFSSADWNPAAGDTSTHGDGQIQVNNVTGYNSGTGYCVNCHTSGAYNFSDTAWAIAPVAGDAITTTCGECHKDGAAPGSISISHAVHGIADIDIAAGGAECVVCHGNNGGSNYQNTLVNNHGNGNIDLLGTRITTYTGGLAKWDGSESTCANTCHATDANPVWDTSANLACNQCHYYDATPTTTENNADSASVGGSHNSHFDAAAVTDCTQCHPDNSGETAPFGHIDGTTLLEKSREGIIADNADMTPLGADFNDGTNTCSNTACHDPSDDGHVSAAWGATNSSCQMCHSNTDPGSGSHTAHMDASTNFGVTINCNSCHPAASGRDHMDLNKDVEISYNSVTTTVVNSATLNGCGTNDCHNDGTSLVSGTPADYTWGTVIADCQECHDATAATVNSNAHNEHLNNGYTTVACTDCHTAASNNTHIDQNVTIDGTKATYSIGAAIAVGTTPDGTCATASCHNQSGGDSVAWNIPAGDVAGTSALTCDSCHYFDVPPNAGASTLSASHGDHFTAGKVCTQCHGALPTTTAHIDNKTTLIDGAVAQQDEAGMEWTHASAVTDYTLAADNSCGSATNNGLGCHATGTPDWDNAFDGTVCSNCHTNTTTSAVNPTSGLHGTANLLKHDDSFNSDKTCTSCHDSSSPSNGHMNGTLQNGGAATYTWNTTFMAAGYVRATDDCAATCHTDGGTWNREWSGVEDVAWTYSDNASSAAVCGNCHGSFATGWNIVGNTSHDNPDADNGSDTLADSAGSHGTCSTCHTWGHNNYVTGTKHINNTLETNSTLGYDNANPDATCSTNCHTGQTLTMKSDSGWTDASVAGDGVTCGGCHTGGVTAGSASGAHTIHGATAASVAADPASIALCATCHGEDGTGATHNDGNLDFSGVTYNTVVRNDETGTCLTSSCHNQGADPSTAWDSSALACDDCHYYEATVADNTNNAAHDAALSNRHDSHFDAGVQCATCHTVPGADDTTHIDGVTDLADKATAAFGEAAIGGSKSIAYTSPNCTNNFSGLGCHATATSEAWNQAADTIACTDCHTNTTTAAVNPTSGLHNTAVLTAHDATLSGGSGNPCEKCHTADPSASHADGNLDTPATWNTAIIPAGYVSGTDSCAATCHSDGGTWNRAWTGAVDTAWAYGDDASSATVCGNCHGSFATGWNIVGNTSHDDPDTDNGADTLATSKDSHAECSSCHTWGHTNYIGANDKHENGLLEMNSTLGYDNASPDATCATSCHGGQTLTMKSDSGWTDASVAGDGVNCSACHGGNYLTGLTEKNFWPDSADETTDSGASENDSGEHLIHMTHLALQDNMTIQNLLDDGNSKTLQIAYCERCHGANAGDAAWHAQGDDVGDVSAFRDMDGTVDDLAPAGSESGNTCSNIDCHNNQNQASPGWYAGVNNAPCTMCHNPDGNNGGNPVKVDPTSGLHFSATPNGAEIHDDAFTGGGECLSCHTINPSNKHVDGTVHTPDQVTFNFLATASIDVKLNTLSDASDDTCASSCHSDSGNWYRLWSDEAYNTATFNASTIDQPLPGNCKVCHGDGVNGWAEGTSHAELFAREGISGLTHNSQNPSLKPGANCVDCHLYPDHLTPGAGAARHENGMITLTDDTDASDDYTPIDDNEGTVTGVYCAPCHELTSSPADGKPGNTFTNSPAFVTGLDPVQNAPTRGIELVTTDRNPQYSCYSGQNGCHGDTQNNWWPHLEETDPAFYPNREGAHYEHGTTIGELLAEYRGRPGNVQQEDRNDTCVFCHPMIWNEEKQVWEAEFHRIETPLAGNKVITDVFGGNIYSDADRKGTNYVSDPAIGSWVYADYNSANGFAYQLDGNPEKPGQSYPLDTDGQYWQYLYADRANPAIRTGVCSQVACHSNSPYTPQWYGDEQPPGQITDLIAYTHNQDGAVHDIYEYDAPGTVHLYWTAPGENGDFDTIAYEYEVYYSDAGPIDVGNLASATRAGGAPTVLRKGESQEMVVDGLAPGTSYWFAVVTKDQPTYEDDDGDLIPDEPEDHDNIYDNWVADGLSSVVGATAGSTAAHADDRPPTFWGITKAESHDTGDAVNLTWDAARDHTLPIDYLVYISQYSLKTHLATGGVLYDGVTDPSGDPTTECFNKGTLVPLVAPSPVGDSGGDYCIDIEITGGLTYQAQVTADVLYNFMVRAKDAYNNVDDNTVVSMALPTSMAKESEATIMGILSGSNGMVMQADPLNPNWGGVSAGMVDLTGNNNVTFISGTDLDGTDSRDMWVQGISIDLFVDNNDRKLPQRFEAQMGYDAGAGFTAIGSPVSVGLGRNAQRVLKVSLSAISDTVPANANLAIRFTRTTNVVPAVSASTSAITLGWGDTTNKGQMMVVAQPINHKPSTPSLAVLSRQPGGYIDITWTPSDDGSDGGQILHYDLLAKLDTDATWKYVIGTGLTDADALAGVRWDTVGDGLDKFNGGNYNVQVKVEASDGYQYETTPGSDTWVSHVTSNIETLSLNNSQDDEPPAAVTISHVEPRPKQGAAFLHWIAVGNDGYNHGTRAAYYDIRYRRTADGALNAGTWDDPATVQAQGELVPGFAGTAQEFELLNMAPDTSYQVAIVTCDAGEDDVPLESASPDDNCSGLSNVYTLTSGQYFCGICHSTPPDEPDTKGTHRQHGYTLEDCANCHGDGTSPDGNNVMTYDGRHYDGVINIGWAKDTSGNHLQLFEIELNHATDHTNDLTITQGGINIYNDPDGAGGYNSGGPYTGTENTDSGRCMNFISANANGCHGPFNPQWAPDTIEPSPKEPACADCHGDDNSTLTRQNDPYGRTWDCNVSGDPSELVKASPPTANHGGTTRDDRYVGAHERHLNSSFRFAKGDSCRLCHKDTFELGLHADGNVDVLFDGVADLDEDTPADKDYTTADTTGMTCFNMNNAYCHDTGANWAEPGAKCNSCHGMGSWSFDTGADVTQIGHVFGSPGDVVECIVCHVPGHPQSPDGITSGDPDALLINNNAMIGINYRSGGIHLRRKYDFGSGEVTFNSLAEICWGCHDQNQDGILREADGDISEFETNNRSATGSSPYDFGTLDRASWIGAIWSSGYGQNASDPFYYKRGAIQSTHSTDPTGTSQVQWDSANGRYNETVDAVSQIRCSNCHDVHNLNLAPNDNPFNDPALDGPPYLRGTWLTNPYEEDGAPWSTQAYVEPTDGPLDYTFGAVPRGGTEYDQLGGYYIDQNNAVPGTGLNANPTPSRYPTSGQTIASSAGLCVMCHTDNVDGMDQRKPIDDPVEGALWLGGNGHSNSVLGGSANVTLTTNVFDYSHGRPSPVTYVWLNNKGDAPAGRPSNTNHYPLLIADMTYVTQGEQAMAGGGYRGTDGGAGGYNPPVTSGTPYGFNVYDWGASIDGTTTDQMYHQFSCSKCHSPHASRLPKLLITNCLDIRHNTWDDSNSSLQNTFTASALDNVDRNQRAAYYASAQNCHRFDPARTGDERGGWNRVSPWVKKNDGTNSEHKGASDTQYGDTSPTYHKFPTEATGW